MAGSELVTEEMTSIVRDIVARGDSLPAIVRDILSAAAPMIAAREREQAAKLVDDYAATIGRLSGGSVPSVIESACATIAAAIRERSA